MIQTIEFRNNGIVDSLTGSMAPELFYENLRREIAAAHRDQKSLSVVSIVVPQRSVGIEAESEYVFAERLIKIASKIDHGTRADEFFSRISENGFWILIRGPHADAEIAIDRAKLDSDIKVDVIEKSEGEPLHSWIHRIDSVHFRSSLNNSE